MFVRTQFTDLYLVDALPAIDEVIMGRYNRFPAQYSKFFRVLKSKRSIEQTTEVTGFGQFATVAEAGDTRYDDALQGFDKTYTHVQRSLGFKVSRIAADDDRWGVVGKLGRELGKSAMETREVVAADIFNNGFNSAFTGPDGKELFATDHPLAGGGTEQNELTTSADLDVASLELALTDFRSFTDHRAKKLRIPPRKLIVPAAGAFNAAEILGGTMRSDTANNTINAFRKWDGMPALETVEVWDYLTDTDAWFLEGDVEDTELRFYDREPFNLEHDVEFNSRSILTAGWMRFSVGWSGFYGVYGSPGA